MFRSATLRILVGLGLCSLGGVMLYIYYKNKDEDEDLIDGTVPINSSLINNKNQRYTMQLTVSNEIVPILIGRSGANLKIIEDKTGTVIKFREKDDDHHYCEINGTKNDVLSAKDMLMKEIKKSPTVKEEIFVPQSAYGKIIGMCGDTLQEICRKSLAKVSVDSGDRRQGNTTRRVVITGTRKQVEIAKRLIQEKVKEDEEYRKSIEYIEQTREPRRSPTSSISSNHSSMQSMNSSSIYLPSGEKLPLPLSSSSLASNSNDNNENIKSLEVYVSAIATPSKFWLQLVGPQSRKLDELVENMTEYYKNEENQKLHKIADPYLGQIVAALFKYDGKWYRAEIVGILPNEYNPRDVVLDLYFVDYGDSEYVAPHEVFELRTDFLTLRFQAIECFLANVKPALSNERDMWDQQAIAKFEELTHVASWKKLVSRVVQYKTRSKGRNHDRREGSPIPGVELYDTSGEIEINIAHALIAEGYAVPDNEQQQISEITTTNDELRLDGTDSKINNENTLSSQNNNHSTTTNSQLNNTKNDFEEKFNSNEKSQSSSSSLLNNDKNFHHNEILNGTNHQTSPSSSSTKQHSNIDSSKDFLQNEKTIGTTNSNTLNTQSKKKNNVIDNNWKHTLQS